MRPARENSSHASAIVPTWLAAAALVSAWAVAPAQVPTSARIHDAAIVFDAHSDFLDRAAADGSALVDDPDGAQTSLLKLEAGHVDAQFFAVFVPPAFRDYGYANRSYELIDKMLREIASNPSRIELATSVADVRRIAESGRIAALLSIEGGHSIENRLEHLRNFYRLGVRSMSLTWSNTNDWADSAGDSGRWSGLSDFGVEVVAEMNRLGMIIDVSHAAEDTFWDVIENSRAPVIASHSAARALMDSEHNLSDDMIVALADAGGVVNVTFFGGHLQPEFDTQYETAIDAAAAQIKNLGAQFLHDPIALDVAQWGLEKRIEATIVRPPLNAVVEHIDHIVNLVGIDHVGMGSDFDGMGSAPAGLEHAGMMPALTEALARRGYDEASLRKILGENLLRVMEETERLADHQRP
jgi:membrane dipeptidase